MILYHYTRKVYKRKPPAYQQRHPYLLKPYPEGILGLYLVKRKSAYYHSGGLGAAVSARVHEHRYKADKQRYSGYGSLKMLQHGARYHR